MTIEDSRDSQEFLDPVQLHRATVNDPKTAVHPLLQLQSEVPLHNVRPDRVSARTIGIERILPITRVFHTRQISRWVREKQQIAIEQRHPIRFEILNEIKYLRRQQVA